MRLCLGPDPNPRRPEFAFPDNVCDTHCHIMGPFDRFPLSETRNYTPPEAPLAAYEAVKAVLGIRRSVIVQPGPHGYDNRVTLDAVARLAPDARGIAVIPPDLDLGELEAMNAAGIRGVRLSTLVGGTSDMTNLGRKTERIAPLGWHVLLHLRDPDELIALADEIRAMPVDVVIDHMARVPGATGTQSAAFKALLDLLEKTDNCWTKICSWYRLSAQGPPYDDMKVLAQAVMQARPDRILWGTNWPHPLLFETPPPNDGDLMALLFDWAQTDAMRQAVFVDNPARLYGFA
jgi:2-pyrone-4,6-dicarboxylate lactonase